MNRPPHLLLALVLLVSLALPSVAPAHQLDEYVQATLVSIEPGDIRLEINLTPGIAVAEEVIGLIDTDHDGVIQPQEANAYGDLLAHDLNVRIDGREVGLKLTACNFPSPVELRTGFEIIQIEYVLGSTADAAGKHLLTIANRHLPAVSVYLVNAAKPRSNSIQIAAQHRNENQSNSEIEFSFEPPSQSVEPIARPGGVTMPEVAVIATAVIVTTSFGTWVRCRSTRKPKSEVAAGL